MSWSSARSAAGRGLKQLITTPDGRVSPICCMAIGGFLSMVAMTAYHEVVDHVFETAEAWGGMGAFVTCYGGGKWMHARGDNSSNNSTDTPA